MNSTERRPAFPVLCDFRGELFTVASWESLTTTTAAALRGGLFQNLRLVDSLGKEYLVNGARKVRGVGPFWGFNVFLNQRIEVALDLEETGAVLAADEVRRWVLRDMGKWPGWETREDFQQLRDAVGAARTVAEIHQLLSSRTQGP